MVKSIYSSFDKIKLHYLVSIAVALSISSCAIGYSHSHGNSIDVQVGKSTQPEILINGEL